MFQILLVDDEHIILNGCRYMIENTLELPFPVRVCTACSVPAAIALLEKQTPQLILTDIRMPVQDGFSLIEYVRQEDIAADLVILTSHADFEYARTALRYNVTDFILKPISEASLRKTLIAGWQRWQERIAEAREIGRRNLLTMTLYDVSASELLFTEEMLEELLPCVYFTVIVAETDGLTPDPEACEALLLTYYDRCLCYFLPERNRLIFLCNHDTFSVRHASLPERLYRTLGRPVPLGISISSNSVDQLHALYNNACQRIFYRRVFGSDDELSGTACVSYPDCVRIFQETDEEAIRRALSDYLDRILPPAPPSPADLMRLYISFFQNIALYFSSSGLSVPKPALSGLPEELGCAQELISAITSRIRQLQRELARDASDQDQDRLAGQLLAFIQSHFREDISLDDLAAAVGLHPNYICTFFKKNIGRSYLNCLHRQRIDAARELLCQTDLNIEEIARQVGYNSSTQFARIFRKYENCSPSDYRNRH